MSKPLLPLAVGFAFALLGSLWASAHGPDQIEVLSLEDEQLANELAKEYTPRLRELIRPAYVYHYVPKNNLHIGPLRAVRSEDPRVLNHLDTTARYFWMSADLGWNGSGNVAGLYAALDPFESQMYGDIAFRIELPKGYRYLDVAFSRSKGWGEAGFSDPVFSKLRSTRAKSKQGFLLEATGDQRQRALANRVLQKLAVSGFLYDWGSNWLPEHCGSHSGAAFVITDTRSITSFRMFSSRTLARFETQGGWLVGDRDNSREVEQDPEYQEALMTSAAAQQLLKTEGFRASPEVFHLNTSAVGERELEKWVHDHLFNCGSEDQWARAAKP